MNLDGEVVYSGEPKNAIEFQNSNPEFRLEEWAGNVWVAVRGKCRIRNIVGIY